MFWNSQNSGKRLKYRALIESGFSANTLWPRSVITNTALRGDSNNNAFLLKDYVEKNDVTKNKNYKINEKHRQYIKDLKNNSWQEIVFDNIKIQ